MSKVQRHATILQFTKASTTAVGCLSTKQLHHWMSLTKKLHHCWMSLTKQLHLHSWQSWLCRQQHSCMFWHQIGGHDLNSTCHSPKMRLASGIPSDGAIFSLDMPDEQWHVAMEGKIEEGAIFPSMATCHCPSGMSKQKITTGPLCPDLQTLWSLNSYLYSELFWNYSFLVPLEILVGVTVATSPPTGTRARSAMTMSVCQ